MEFSPYPVLGEDRGVALTERIPLPIITRKQAPEELNNPPRATPRQ